MIQLLRTPVFVTNTLILVLIAILLWLFLKCTSLLELTNRPMDVAFTTCFVSYLHNSWVTILGYYHMIHKEPACHTWSECSFHKQHKYRLADIKN